MVERPVQSDNSRHSGLAALPAAIEEHPLGCGAQQVPLPGVWLQTQPLGEAHTVQGELEVLC